MNAQPDIVNIYTLKIGDFLKENQKIKTLLKSGAPVSDQFHSASALITAPATLLFVSQGYDRV